MACQPSLRDIGVFPSPTVEAIAREPRTGARGVPNKLSARLSWFTLTLDGGYVGGGVDRGSRKRGERWRCPLHGTTASAKKKLEKLSVRMMLSGGSAHGAER